MSLVAIDDWDSVRSVIEEFVLLWKGVELRIRAF